MLSSPRHVHKALVFLLIAALFACAAPVSAFAKTHPHTRHHKTRHHARHYGAPVSSSAAYSDIVIDAETGKVLHASGADQLRHPASLTKMMTLYLTFQALANNQLNLNQYIPVSSNAAEQSPSKLGLRPGQRIRVEDIIFSIVTLSANDSAVVLGEWLGGSEQGFAQKMNAQARLLGMTHTHYNNPSGLPDPEQVTTARDMAILARALIHDFPQFYHYFSLRHFTYAGINHPNHNHLMERYDGMDGIKTGYIRASGFNLVASAMQGGTRVIGVMFGGKSARSRDDKMAKLLDQSFSVVAQLKRTHPVMAKQTPETEDKPEENTQIAQGDAADPADTPAALPPSTPLQTQASAPVVAPAATWSAQIGSYTDPAIARQALASAQRHLPVLLGQVNTDVQSFTDGHQTTYRARFIGLDQSVAQKICVGLSQQNQECLIVAP